MPAFFISESSLLHTRFHTERKNQIAFGGIHYVRPPESNITITAIVWKLHFGADLSTINQKSADQSHKKSDHNIRLFRVRQCFAAAFDVFMEECAWKRRNASRVFA